MNRNRTQLFSVRPNTHHPLTLACVTGLLTLGLATSALGAGITGGQGGSGSNGGGNGGNSGNGGGGGGVAYNGVAGANGSGGAGGNGTDANGGAGGGVGSMLTVSSTVTTATTGSSGGNGSYGNVGGGGGGGGGDGIYATNGITVTNQSVITGGNGGYGGGSTLTYGGGGGGGGYGLAGSGLTIVNSGTIAGGNGGISVAGGAPYGGGGGGGGHGVIGSNLTITNGGKITAGAGANGSGGGLAGTTGDAILFTGGASNLAMLTGSMISGNIELATGAKATMYAKNAGLTLTSNVVLDAVGSQAYLNTALAGLTVSGVISGSGSLGTSGVNPYSLILTGANTFTGGTTVFAGDLQVDGRIGDVAVNGGILGGTGLVGNITLSSSGAIAPGDSPGTLHGTSLTWNGGGAFDFQLGATNSTTDTDLLALSGALTKGSAGTYVFHFSDGNGPPKLGVTYTLISSNSISGFSASDFSYDYTGADPSLVGHFVVNGNLLQFTTTTTPVTLQSFEVD